jgi:2-polyprenyl-3-methyl-5-hydroxy-6-metoxy-1,4-benzoquinol methylase
MKVGAGMSNDVAAKNMDHSSDDRFRDYYEEKSESPPQVAHFTRIRDKVLATRSRLVGNATDLRVLDIGCNAGTQARLWAELGHRVTGLDVNEPLLGVAAQRAKDRGLQIQFDLGTATSLPYASGSMDVCLMLELLEHVQDWQPCVSEAIRVLAPGGLLYLSTTNALCPKQQEFNLPFYSWYPAPLKRHYERLSVTTRPALANYARYPAVHWFTYAGLRDRIQQSGLQCFDRFDLIDTDKLTPMRRAVTKSVLNVPPLRWLGHVMTAGTTVMAFKKPEAGFLKR